jgi:ribonuclease BN (tRNA processing enzyme)
MKMLCLGVGDAFSARWYSTCLAVEHGGTWLLIDCPHPIRKILREGSATVPGGLDLKQIDAVVLTHRHGDHASGLEGAAFYNQLVLRRPLTLLTHPLVMADLWDRYLAATLNASGDRSVSDFFDHRPLSEDTPIDFGPFQIECRRTQHSVPTFALRLTAGGRTLALSSDTAYDPSLIDWLATGADLIVHETNVGPHTPYEKLAELPSEIRSRMRLYHYPDDFDIATSLIEPLAPGRLYDV